jgi:enamine deaminase RidA (YjgF/YER057c/UK114 family)
MAQRKVNPWKWQDQFAFSQAIDVSGATRTLYCAGQASVDGEGRPVHAGNMSAQLDQAFRNLATVLEAAGFTMGDIVRLNYYTTDVDGFFQAQDVVGRHLGAAASQPAGALLGVTRLAFPDLLVEIEATAAK